MLRELTEAPPSPINRKCESFVERDIIDFAQSGMAVAEISYEGKTWRNTYQAARHWVRKYHELCPGVAVTRRGERIYLVKEGE